MNLLYLALIGIFIFLTLSILRKWFDCFVLIAFSIGAACSANFYNGLTMPIVAGPFIFAIDSILITIFINAIVIKYLHYSSKDAKSMAIACVVAIIISAIFELFAKSSSLGYSRILLENFLNSLLSAFASLIGIWFMFIFLNNSKKMNVYLRCFLAIFIGTLVNTGIFMIGLAFIDGIDFWGIVGGLFIGKLYSAFLALFFYWVNGKFLIPSDLKEINHHELEK